MRPATLTSIPIACLSLLIAGGNLSWADESSNWPKDLPVYDHVLIVIEENKDFDQVVAHDENSTIFDSANFINGTLLREGALFQKMYGEEHHSQGNYFWLFCGARPDANFNFNDQTPKQPLVIDNLASQLQAKHLTFKGYAEDQPMVNGKPSLVDFSDEKPHRAYARKHVPWISFPHLASDSLPLTDFPKDFGQLPTVSFVIPNLEHDMHNGDVPTAVAVGDKWLADNLGAYYAWAKTHNSLLIITFDENDDSIKDGSLTDPTAPTTAGKDHSNRTVTIFAGAHIKPGFKSEQKINHVTILRTLEAMYGLPKIGAQEESAIKAGLTDDAIITDVFNP